MRSVRPLLVLSLATLALAACETPPPAAPAAPAPSAAPADTTAPMPPSDPGAAGSSPADSLPQTTQPVSPPAVRATDLQTTGTVKRVEVEGGGWVIETPEGTFQPLDLPTPFQHDGLAVRVTLRPNDDVATTLQAGRPADLVRIALR